MIESYPCSSEAKESHDICLALLKKKMTEQLSLQEFLTEIAYAALKFNFDEIRPRQFPYRIKEMVEFDNLKPALKAEIKRQSEFWKEPNVANYLLTCQAVKSWNQAQIQWLKELAALIPQEDTESQGKIKNRLMDFGVHISLEAQKAAEVFDGQFV